MERSLLLVVPTLLVAACGLIDPIVALDDGFDAKPDATDAATDKADASDAGDGASDAQPTDAPSDAQPTDAPSDAVAFDCAPPNNANPCVNVSNAAYGCYCGTSTENQFNRDAARSSCLYYCQSSVVTKDVYCPLGCIVAEAGSPDKCVGGGGC